MKNSSGTSQELRVIYVALAVCSTRMPSRPPYRLTVRPTSISLGGRGGRKKYQRVDPGRLTYNVQEAWLERSLSCRLRVSTPIMWRPRGITKRSRKLNGPPTPTTHWEMLRNTSCAASLLQSTRGSDNWWTARSDVTHASGQGCARLIGQSSGSGTSRAHSDKSSS